MATNHEGTSTSEGFIPHLNLNGMRFPVALKVIEVESVGKAGYRVVADEYDRPVADYAGNGEYFFATPGGGRIRAATIVCPKHVRSEPRSAK